MNKNVFVFILSFAIHYSVIAQNAESFVDSSKPFLLIEDKNREAEAWATCAATYQIFSEFYLDDRPALSTQLKNQSNGAELAVTISMVLNEMEAGDISKRFDSVWSYSKLAGDEMPKVAYTTIMAELEQTSSQEETNDLSAKLTKTFEVCYDNLEGQQFYIDTWRELAKSGLLTIPEE